MNLSAIEALPIQIEPSDWPELSYRLTLTDGLPTFPPERGVVTRLIAGAGFPADHIVGSIPPSGRVATVESIAANAAMAGCLPQHLPVVIAAIDAMLEPRFNLAGVVTTTHPCWPLVIVSGRAVTDLGMATGESLFSGGGARANLAIGRAIRLVLWNLGGAYPREPVQEIMGHPGRMAYCIAEEPNNTPWELLHEARGLRGVESAITVFACEGPQIANLWGVATPSSAAAPSSADARDAARVGERWLELVADQMSARGNSNTHTLGEMLVVISPSMARTLAAEGWTRPRVQEFLWQTARRRLGDIRVEADGSPALDPSAHYDWWPDWIDQSDPETRVPVTWSPDAIHLVVSGADSIPCAAVCPSWGHLGGFAMTRALPVGEAADGGRKNA
ncbi:MAG: hypothetical protein JRG90_18045 [Deltaproteobacteria bacterium]|nr:hypothetical protein [Deltaproteobacteria bacterium]